MKRARGGNEEGDSASWMTTYSDMMTLLFAFFVLLFAISNVDSKKSQLLAAAFSQSLTPELFEAINSEYPVTHGSIIDMGIDSPQHAQPDKTGPSSSTDGTDSLTSKREGYVGDLYSALEEYIAENNLDANISLEYDGQKLLITLRDDLWFASGSAEINENMMERAILIARLFRENQVENQTVDIVVAGHTDNVPINTPRYPSNWELSFARAVSFLHVLINESGLPTAFFSARAYGEELPIADNSTPEGRQKNRRVEILVSD